MSKHDYDIHDIPVHKFKVDCPIPSVVLVHDWDKWEVLYIDGKKVSQGFPFSRFELLKLASDYEFTFGELVRHVMSDKDQYRLATRGYLPNDIDALDLYYSSEVG